MHKRIEVGVVLLFLAGCGTGEVPETGTTSAAVDNPDPCPPGTYTYNLTAKPVGVTEAALKTAPTPNMPVAGDGSGEDTSIGVSSTYNPNLYRIGSRKLTIHPNSHMPHTYSFQVKNSIGSIIGHVALGAAHGNHRTADGRTKYLDFVSTHISVPASGVNIYIRYGFFAASDNGQLVPWFAVRNAYGTWGQYMTLLGMQNWVRAQTSTVQLALKAAGEASNIAYQNRQSQPYPDVLKDLMNADGVCNGNTWLAVATLLVSSCGLAGIPVVAPVCALGLVSSAYCSGLAIYQVTRPSPTQTNYPDTGNKDSGNTGPEWIDPGDESAGLNLSGGGTDGGSTNAPEGDGGSNTGAVGCP